MCFVASKSTCAARSPAPCLVGFHAVSVWMLVCEGCSVHLLHLLDTYQFSHFCLEIIARRWGVTVLHVCVAARGIGGLRDEVKHCLYFVVCFSLDCIDDLPFSDDAQ